MELFDGDPSFKIGIGLKKKYSIDCTAYAANGSLTITGVTARLKNGINNSAIVLLSPVANNSGLIAFATVDLSAVLANDPSYQIGTSLYLFINVTYSDGQVISYCVVCPLVANALLT